VTAPDLSGVEQLPQPDPRGWLALRYLPDDLRRAEDATQAADRQHPRYFVGFVRPATPAERTLLTYLGHTLPEELTTVVRWVTTGCRNRRWPALEEGNTP